MNMKMKLWLFSILGGSVNAFSFCFLPRAQFFRLASLCGLPLLLALGYRSVFVRENKQREDVKTKRRKARRKKEKKSLPQEPKLNSERQPHSDSLGKLTVFYDKEIAFGSNGSTVYKGTYGGYHVAVKSRLLTHYKVLQKEIDDLIKSDHTNIVKYYGIEYDKHFVYMAVECCDCSLSKLMRHYSRLYESSRDDAATSSRGLGSILSKEDMVFWNGLYPSPKLIKLMSDIVAGLAYLHGRHLMHRDLKPRNVLITFKDGDFCAKLADMGITKLLVRDGYFFTQNSRNNGKGTVGWRAPELIYDGPQTRAADLFSLGCVLFFCMTGGKHPFGEGDQNRDLKVMKNEKDQLFLVDSVPEAVDLISQLLDNRQELRPEAERVLNHPLLWGPDKRLTFLSKVSDLLEMKDEHILVLRKALEATASKSVGQGRWGYRVSSSLLNDLHRFMDYSCKSVCDLLRCIRNILHHYEGLSPETLEILGSNPGGIDKYFRSQFPNLLMEVYKVLRAYRQGDHILREYLV